MRIIVATGLNAGAAEYRNMGDVAMLQVAIERLFKLWPEARIDVLTESSSNLERYCPGTKPVPRAGCECWVGDGLLLGRYHLWLPEWASHGLSRLKRSVGLRWPGLLKRMILLRLRLRDEGGRRGAFEVFLEAFQNADLLVVSGSGGFADSGAEWNRSILGMAEAAIRRRIPVVMFGQGMGPLNDPTILSRAREIFPQITLISLRGNRGALSLLDSLGVSRTRVLTTGDEAIEPAFAARVEEPGYGIGINLRVASYSGVKSDCIGEVASVLQAFARRQETVLLPLPIAVHEYARDHETIRELLTGFDDKSDGGSSLDTPLLLIKQTGRCRMVVTGAYHAAVFALAQGIPVVGMCNSPYYLSKFQGLQDTFGLGCAIVQMSEAGWPGKFAEAIETTWNSAEAVRLPLLKSSARMIGESQGAYCRVKAILASRQTRPASFQGTPADRTESEPCRAS